MLWIAHMCVHVLVLLVVPLPSELMLIFVISSHHSTRLVPIPMLSLALALAPLLSRIDGCYRLE